MRRNADRWPGLQFALWISLTEIQPAALFDLVLLPILLPEEGHYFDSQLSK